MARSARFFHRYLFQGVMSSFWKRMRSCTEPFSEWVDPNDHFQAIIARFYATMPNTCKCIILQTVTKSLMLTFTSIFYHWNVSTLDEGRWLQASSWHARLASGRTYATLIHSFSIHSCEACSWTFLKITQNKNLEN